MSLFIEKAIFSIVNNKIDNVLHLQWQIKLQKNEFEKFNKLEFNEETLQFITDNNISIDKLRSNWPVGPRKKFVSPTDWKHFFEMYNQYQYSNLESAIPFFSKFLKNIESIVESFDGKRYIALPEIASNYRIDIADIHRKYQEQYRQHFNIVK